jgi:hypothetical protein
VIISRIKCDGGVASGVFITPMSFLGVVLLLAFDYDQREILSHSRLHSISPAVP